MVIIENNKKVLDIENDRKIINDNNHLIKNLTEYNEEIVRNLEEEIAKSLPLPTQEEINNPKKEKEYLKRLEKYKKKLKASFLDGQVKNVIGLRNEIQNTRKENLKLINREFIYQRSKIERIREFIAKKSFIQVGILDRTGSIKYHNVKPENTNTVIVEDGEYILDTSGLLRKEGRPTFHYFKGVPHPITYDHERNQVLVTSETLNKIWNTKIINQLFDVGNGSLAKTLMWTAGGIMSVGIVIVMILAVAPDSFKTMLGMG